MILLAFEEKKIEMCYIVFVDKDLVDFYEFRDIKIGEKAVLQRLRKYENTKEKYLFRLRKISKKAEDVYPSQGMLLTPFDNLDIFGFKTIPTRKIIKTLRLRTFFLMLFNHPYRIAQLNEVNMKKFVAPPKIGSQMMENSLANGEALSIRDFGATTNGYDKERISRTKRYGQGPFVKLGRQARSLFVGSANPDVWGTGMSIATMAASHCLAGIPRNGLFADIKRQADMANEAIEELEAIAEIVLKNRRDKAEILTKWKANLMGVVEPSADKALERAEALYKVGVRSFRIYSPEPGIGPVVTVTALRKRFGDKVEIFTGQIVSVEQAQAAQSAGADGIYLGIGGGGRCTTGVRSGSAIDWPELVWNLRGEIDIPIIVEGGASDHIATTLLLGASGIGVSRIASGGTIESPGGCLYCVSGDGMFFKPYGGEASARAKYGEGKMLAFGIPSFIEGETTKAYISYVKNAQPTIAYNLHSLNEDAILALVFRGAEDIVSLQAIDPSPLRRISSMGADQARTH